MLHRCTTCSNISPGGEQMMAGRSRFFTVDLHCHALSTEVEALVAKHPKRLAEPDLMVRTLGAESAAYNALQLLPKVTPQLTDIDRRLADMDAMGVDVQVVSPSPTQYYYWAEAPLARELVRVQNEYIAEMCSSHPGRLRGLGMVALQHPELAAEQLRYAVQELGLAGVEISTAVEGRELADPALAAFWQAAAELRCIVFIHPLGTSAFQRLDRWYLTNIIGQPFETTVALSQLMFGGVLDRHPDLKLLAAHGGGYLPAYLGRFEHAWRERPDSRSMSRPPIEYLRRIYFDTLVYEPKSIRHLIDVVGESQVVLGTDYPFDMGSYAIATLIDEVQGLDERGRAAIMGGNALGLLEEPNRITSNLERHVDPGAQT